MHIILKTAACTLAAVTMTANAAAQKQWTVTGQEVPGFAAIDNEIRQQMIRYDISGSSVAITKDGRLVYARGYTWDAPDVEPVQPTSLFRTASVAKSITSIAIHQLIEDGLLSYDTRVADALGLTPPPGRSADPWLDLVTVDHLLTHTIGWDKDDGGIDPMVFQDWWISLRLGVMPPPTRQEIATFMTGEPFQFHPGTRWAYCNFGYLLLQMLAEEVTGVDFPEYVQDNLFRPIGVGRARMAHSRRSDLAPTEVVYVGDYEGDPYAMGWENAFAAGGMVLSAPDLARLYTALFDAPNASGLLRRHTLNAMLANPFQASREMGYGRGWIFERFFVDLDKHMGGYIDLDDDLEVYAHGGGAPGVHTIAAWRTDGYGFFWMSNKDPLVDDFDSLLDIGQWPEHDLWESVGISREPVGSAPVESWVPAVAHTDGVGGSTWRSDVGLLNRSPSPNIVRLRYWHGWEAQEREIELLPGESRVIPDVVDWFDHTGSGPLQVFSSEALTTTSRTYNESSNGTFGQSLDGVTATGGLEAGDSVVLMQLREDRYARTNIGINNQWRRGARVEIELYDGDGSLVTAHTRLVMPLQTVQLNRPFRELGDRTDVASGYAIIKVLSGQDIYVYGSVIDNDTGDPIAIPMKAGEGSHQQWIAAASHGSGVQDSQWRTDVCVLNLSGMTANVEVTFLRSDGDRSSLSTSVEDREQVVLGDIVAELGTVGSGSLEVDSDRPVLASSRTYNDSDDGTFGLFLDGVSEQTTADRGDSVWLSQLRQNQDFRTNFGLLNSSDDEARVRFFFYDSAGNELLSRTRTLEAGAWVQYQEPISRLAGRTDIDSGSAKVEIMSGEGVIAYASVIDNATNDGTAIAMQR